METHITDKNLEFFFVETDSLLLLPYANEGIKAGFPSPTHDYTE